MQRKNKIQKKLYLIDLTKDMISMDNENPLDLVESFDLPEKYKKIIIVEAYNLIGPKVVAYINRKQIPTKLYREIYINTYELITDYPFENDYTISTKIGDKKIQTRPRYSIEITPSEAQDFYNQITKNGYFGQYLQLLTQLFKIENKYYVDSSSEKTTQKNLKIRIISELIK